MLKLAIVEVSSKMYAMSFWTYLAHFFNSNFFIALATLGVGSFAYAVYRKQKRDAKRDAASIILVEIENAERELNKVSDAKPFPEINEEEIVLMRTASWDKYKYLFVRNFDRNEWDKITDFFVRCIAYDSASSFRNSAFEKNQQELRINMQRIFADYADEYNGLLLMSGANTVKLEQDYIAKRKQFLDIYANTSTTHMYSYDPVKPYNDAKRALNGLETSLSLTSVGIKLKQLSQKSGLFKRLTEWLSGTKAE